jgi:hypothetical protein
LDLHAVTYEPSAKYHRWTGQATHDGKAVRTLIWGETLEKFRAAGIDTDAWPKHHRDTRVYPVKAQVRVEWQSSYGLRVIEVEAA